MAAKDMFIKIRSFGKQCSRVIKLLKKPNRQEFAAVVKVTALGMAAIGFIGFVLFMGKELLF